MNQLNIYGIGPTTDLTGLSRFSKRGDVVAPHVLAGMRVHLRFLTYCRPYSVLNLAGPVVLDTIKGEGEIVSPLKAEVEKLVRKARTALIFSCRFGAFPWQREWLEARKAEILESVKAQGENISLEAAS